MKFQEWMKKSRSPEEVINNHLNLRQGSHDRIDQDLKRNYSDNVIIQTNFGTFHGKDGLRKCAAILKKQLPCAKYNYKKRTIKDNKGELYWSGECGNTKVENGYDTYFVEDG